MKNEAETQINWKKHIPFYVLEAVLLVAAICALVVVGKATGVRKVNLNKDEIEANADKEAQSTGNSGSVYTADGNETLSAEDEELLVNKEAAYQELYEKYNGTFNLAFFGVDSRKGELGSGTRSDSIMICSIDMETHEVKLVSVYRDTYLNIGNDTYNKCNAAYAKGGPERALSMINLNTDLYLTDYITVGFEGLIGVIDALDGVTINVEEEEIFHLNNYQKSMAEELGIEEYTPVVYAGYQSLNGLQATAYCRIRATSGYDFRRAERQRTVVAAMLEKAKQVKLGSLTAAVSALLPSIQTSLSLNDILAMVTLASDYQVTVSEGFPFEGMLNGGSMGTIGSFVVPTDLVNNVEKLHLILFDEEDYEPSDAVKRYSGKIKSDTEPYLLY